MGHDIHEPSPQNHRVQDSCTSILRSRSFVIHLPFLTPKGRGKVKHKASLVHQLNASSPFGNYGFQTRHRARNSSLLLIKKQYLSLASYRPSHQIWIGPGLNLQVPLVTVSDVCAQRAGDIKIRTTNQFISGSTYIGPKKCLFCSWLYKDPER
ncbi:hypothetical protein P167DRAFT_66852 [Morchella conica CCBAS932]|uniref:Uncharacterized protein n=1 Tax=Morchella conica CCBAS932 TaxID=1392247 RepID=A0A3N4KUW5_9PEZI|nr:hypothetical protein P167DRAFT_66852 [Morchella conica CCBAS932]